MRTWIWAGLFCLVGGGVATAQPAIKKVTAERDPVDSNWTWYRVAVDGLDPADTQTTLFIHLDGMVETGGGILNDDRECSVGPDGTFYFGVYGTAADYPGGVVTITLTAWSGEAFSEDHVFASTLGFAQGRTSSARPAGRHSLYVSAVVAPAAKPADAKPSETKPSQKPDPKREPNEKDNGKPKKETPLFPTNDKGEVIDKTKTDKQIEENKNQNRSDTGENDATRELIKGGYKVVRNPPPSPNGKRPDMTIEGEYADVYTPGPGKDARGVGGEVVDKVDERKQVKRVIINLRDNDKVTPDQIRKDIADRRAKGELKELEEVKVITRGPPREIVTVFP